MKSENVQQEGTCPACHKKMERVDSRHYVCKNCNQNYLEEFFCPTCHGALEQVKGCGSISYLCRKDGLVSSSKIQFHYNPQSGE